MFQISSIAIIILYRKSMLLSTFPIVRLNRKLEVRIWLTAQQSDS